MPGKSKSSLSRSSSRARRIRDARAAESQEQREARLIEQRHRQETAIAAETQEQRERRLREQRDRQASSRDREAAEQREARLDAVRAHNEVTRQSESAEQREARLAAVRAHNEAARQSESAEQREARLAAVRAHNEATRQSESAEQREARLAADRAYHEAARQLETEEQREARLAADRAYHDAARELETEDQREARLAADRAYHEAARELETEEQMEARLAADRAYHEAARQLETEEQMEARLAADRAYHEAAREHETEDQREARLAADRAYHEAVRQQETQAESDTRRRSDRLRRAQHRRELPEEEHLRRLQVRTEEYAQCQEQDERQRNSRRLETTERRSRAHEEGRQLEDRRQREYISWSDREGSGFNYNPLINYKIGADIGAMDICCLYCRALKWRGETPSMCCAGGKVRLPPLEDLPDLLKSLIVECNHEYSKHFLSNIRAYNSAFIMTSFGAKEIREGGFMPTFKVRGQVYHRIGSLLPPEGNPEQFLQLYFVADEKSQATMRMSYVPNLKENLVLRLQGMLHEVNPLVRELKTSLENLQQGDTHQIIIRADRIPRGEHPGRYNQPTVDEVAVILVGQEHNRRDIILKKREGGLRRISETHRSYDALQYPIIFPRGEDGYHLALRHVNPDTDDHLAKKMSPKEFYSFRFMIRRDDSNRLLRYCQLTNQFIVDMYAKVETERLIYLRTHQRELRSEEYAHIQDALREDVQARDVGRPVILPSSFVGGPRYMHEKTQDAFMYVRKYSRPDLFITFTTNPKWEEITTNIFHGTAH